MMLARSVQASGAAAPVAPVADAPLPAADLDHVLESARGAWDAVRGERVLFTGGTGFIGSWLLESLARANDRLSSGIRATVLTRDPRAFARRMPWLAARPEITLLRGDVRDFAFPEGRFGCIIHGATDSRASVQKADPALLVDTVVNGTQRVLEFAATAHVPHALFLSSGAIYGPQPADLERLPETWAGAPDPMSPGATYGEAKRLAEHLCRLASGERHGVRIARLFALLGPRLPLDDNFAAGNFLRDALAGGPIEVSGDGRALRSYLHAADVTAWLVRILVEGRPAHPYNVGSPDAVPIAELAATVARVAGPGVGVRIAGAPQPGPPSRYVPDVSRARAELGLEPHIDLESGLRRTLAWLRDLR